MTARTSRRRALATAAALIALAATGCDAIQDGSYQQEFGIAQCALAPTGRNPYFILEPGHQLVLEGGGTRLEITVLDETRQVAGVTARVVEEKEWKGGALYEVARNFFAICERTKDVFYFGEDVDFYENDKVVGHAGTWLAGRNGAKPGLIMPGAPRVGMKYYQELAPGAAMDRAEIVALNETVRTPAGTFERVLKVKERSSLDFWSSLRFWEAEYKAYAPGIGLVQDEDLVLTRYGSVAKK
jgi:hypothetical protein